MNHRTRLAVDALVACARPFILTEFRADSCIASTRVVIDVLRRFRIQAEPLTVNAVVWNRAAVEKIERLGRVPESREELVAWEVECGAWNVAIGCEAPSGSQVGHVVALVEGGTLVDLSLDQADRPQHHIKLRPFAAVVPLAFLEGRERFVFDIDGQRLVYALSKQSGFRLSRDWHDKRRTTRIVTRLTDLVRVALA